MCIEKIPEENKQDVFEDNEFNPEKWTAPVLTSPKAIRRQINKFALRGRKIKNLKIIGLDFLHTREAIECEAYDTLTALPEDKRWSKATYFEIDDDTQLNRCAEINNPILIEFDDGDIFEIGIPLEHQFRISMNHIPWQAELRMVGRSNVDADDLFFPCKHKAITFVNVNIDENDRSIASAVEFCFLDGMRLRISGCYGDFCRVECIEPSGEYSKISFRELSEIVFNEEDLHEDLESGVIAKGSTIFFGYNGMDYVDSPFFAMYSTGSEDSRVNISAKDFVLLGWSIAIRTKKGPNKNHEYELSYSDWQWILSNAKHMLSAEGFDRWFDYLSEYKDEDGYIMSTLIEHGTRFWRDRELYSTQIEDLERWSDVVLWKSDTMILYELW